MRQIDGSIDLSRLCLTELPDLSAAEVIGSFSCDNNWLTSLAGSPFSCHGFHAFRNKLRNLIGAPRRVMGSFNVADNPLESIEGLPEYIQNALMLPEIPGLTEEHVRSICQIDGYVTIGYRGLIYAPYVPLVMTRQVPVMPMEEPSGRVYYQHSVRSAQTLDQ